MARLRGRRLEELAKVRAVFRVEFLFAMRDHACQGGYGEHVDHSAATRNLQLTCSRSSSSATLACAL